jgi:hypothetical protein
MRKSGLILGILLALFLMSGAAFAAGKDLLVVEGSYDNIEDVLKALGLEDRTELIPNGKSDITAALDSGNYKALFINCGSGQGNTPDPDLIERVRDFVHGGGMLYVTDHAANFLEAWDAEMGYDIDYDLHDYDSGNRRTAVVDPALRAQFPPSRFDAGGSILIYHSADDGEPILDPGTATVLLRNASDEERPDRVQAIDFKPAAGGRVVYTTFHNHAGYSAEENIPFQNVLTVMGYIVGSLGTISEQEALLALIGAKPEDVIGSPQGGPFFTLTDGWTFSVPESVTAADLTFALYASTSVSGSISMANWVGAMATGAVFSLTAPDGQTQQAQADPRTAPVVFHAPTQPGLWTIKCTEAGGVPDGQITTAMVLGDRFGAASPSPVSDLAINIPAIDGVIVPVTGVTPVTAITPTTQYTGTVTWSPADAVFAIDTIYTATITLTPTVGYTLTGVTADFFTVVGATTVTNSADSGTVTAVFPVTTGGGSTVVNIPVIAGVIVPVTGATPVTAITPTTQYTGTVTWNPVHATFAADTVYSATITLTPAPGYTLTGVAANFFTVAGATTVFNIADSGTVMAMFPSTGSGTPPGGNPPGGGGGGGGGGCDTLGGFGALALALTALRKGKRAK